MVENEKNQSRFFNENYNEIVSREEIDSFCAGIKAKIISKAEEIGITEEELLRLSRLSDVYMGENLTKEEKKEKIIFFQKELRKKARELNIPIEKLSNLVRFDLDSLSSLASRTSKDLDEEGKMNKSACKGDLENAKTKIKRGDFEQIKYNLEDGLKELEAEKKFALSTESVAAHKVKISKASLLLYLSSAIAGAPILKEIIDKEIAKGFYGKDLTLKALAENPELIREIDEFDNKNTPLDILTSYYYIEPLSYNNTILEFGVDKEYNKNNEQEKVVRIKGLDSDTNKMAAFKDDFRHLSGTHGGDGHFLPLDKFIENKEKIIELIGKDFDIPKEEAVNYTERLLLPDVSRISIVPLKDFKIDTAINYSQKMAEYDKKDKEINEKYLNGSGTLANGGWNDTALMQEMDDLKQWAIKNKIDGKSPISKFMNFKYVEETKGKKNINDEMENNFEQFHDLFIKALEKEGETIDHLKEVSKDNPEKIIEIIGKVLGKNIRYDYEEKNDILAGNIDKMDEKHEKGISFSTLSTGLGVCHDYAATYAAAKHVLEKEGVSNLDKFMVLATTSYKAQHAWTILITFNEKGNIVMAWLDLTLADDEDISKIPGQLDAGDKNHSYSAEKTNVEKMHQKAINKILEYNKFVELEKLREMFMQYYKKEYGILIDKE